MAFLPKTSLTNAMLACQDNCAAIRVVHENRSVSCYSSEEVLDRLSRDRHYRHEQRLQIRCVGQPGKRDRRWIPPLQSRVSRRMVSRHETEVDLNSNSSHAQIVELVGYDRRVLDVGTSTGYLAEVLAEHGCSVTGIELNPEAALQAEKCCDRVIVGDVESLDLGAELGDESFDVIVFGDVLQHLKNPLLTLKHAEGCMVASIPNVAHGSVRLALMQGEFRYRPQGLLDNSHLKFFTRESVEQLFEDAGLLITESRRTTLGVFDTEIEIDREQVTDEVLQQVEEDPESLTYQFVLRASPFGGAATMATYEKLLYALTRRLRGAEHTERLLDIRTRQLADRDQEVARLAQQVVELNNRLANLVQFGREEA
jgi:2-polyprenyl-3-methyl-5-hydroxy-6-metoxy-1,4-benzoquinol methylase